MSVKEMIKSEIDHLPEDVLVEVYDFIHFLEYRQEKNSLAKAAQELSTKFFDKIWNNDEDSVYNNL